MIQIIPAIDIIGGKCVRLTQGDYSSVTEYNSYPLGVAREFEAAGFERLHLVDLDGAREGRPVNLDVLEKICSTTGLTVDFGGGIKSDADIERVFAAGASMLTVGSVAVKKPDLFLAWLNKYGPEKIILGADFRDGYIAVDGWSETSAQSLFDFLDYYVERGVRKVISTDIQTDGTLQGPSVRMYRDILDRYPALELTASGGLGSLDDLRALNDAGIKSVISGKAFYESKIPLRPYPLETLARRIIPCLDIKDGRVVKGVNFVGLRDAGDPVELARSYSEQGADELVFLDITATHEKRKTLSELVRQVAGTINIPFTVGGGITGLDDVNAMLASGADKVSVNSAAVRDPGIINKMAARFGSQCIVLAVDARKEDGTWQVYLNGGRLPTGIDLFEWVTEAVDRGAGEVLFTSMDHDGTRKGYANDVLVRISGMVDVPLVASGGAGELSHFKDAFVKGRADAALAAGLFHYGELSIAEVKNYLAANGIVVRQ